MEIFNLICFKLVISLRPESPINVFTRRRPKWSRELFGFVCPVLKLRQGSQKIVFTDLEIPAPLAHPFLCVFFELVKLLLNYNKRLCKIFIRFWALCVLFSICLSKTNGKSFKGGASVNMITIFIPLTLNLVLFYPYPYSHSHSP